MKMKQKPKKENSERWLLTYSDMITLLLALFILLYGMSTVDQAKYEQFAETLNQQFGDGKGISIFEGKSGVLDNNGNAIMPNSNGLKGNADNTNTAVSSVTPNPTQTPSPTQAANPNDNSLTTAEEMNNLEKGIDQIISKMNAKDSVGTALAERGLTVSLSDNAFFDSGKAQLKPEMKKGLSQIAALLNKITNPIIIEGYTDSVPVSASSTYSSNWELSGARAAAVAEYLADKEKIDYDRIAGAVGHADSNPIASNKTEEGRRKNRRVDITILYN